MYTQTLSNRHSKQHIPGRIAMAGGHAPGVAGIVGRKQFADFRPPYFAHDDPVRTHPQAGPDQVPYRYRRAAFCIGIPGLECSANTTASFPFDTVREIAGMLL